MPTPPKWVAWTFIKLLCKPYQIRTQQETIEIKGQLSWITRCTYSCATLPYKLSAVVLRTVLRFPACAHAYVRRISARNWWWRAHAHEHRFTRNVVLSIKELISAKISRRQHEHWITSRATDGHDSSIFDESHALRPRRVGTLCDTNRFIHNRVTESPTTILKCVSCGFRTKFSVLEDLGHWRVPEYRLFARGYSLRWKLPESTSTVLAFLCNQCNDS